MFRPDVDEQEWIEDNDDKIHRMNTPNRDDGLKWYFPVDESDWPAVPNKFPSWFTVHDKRDLLRSFLAMTYCTFCSLFLCRS